MKEIYLLDASALIDAKNIFYDMDVFPAFWRWLDSTNRDGEIFSVREVRKELLKKQDNLAKWVRSREDRLFLDPDIKVYEAHQRISDWADQSGYTPAAINEFLNQGKADSWLIAHAMAHGYVVVTHEVPGQDPEKIKIPDVCKEFGVKHMNLFDMLKKIKPVF